MGPPSSDYDSENAERSSLQRMQNGSLIAKHDLVNLKCPPCIQIGSGNVVMGISSTTTGGGANGTCRVGLSVYDGICMMVCERDYPIADVRCQVAPVVRHHCPPVLDVAWSPAV